MTYDEILEIPCRTIKTYPDEKIEQILDVVVDHYYEHGFPYYPIDPVKASKEYEALKQFDVSRLELPDNHLQQAMLGLNTVNSFHPEMWSVRCRNAKTPIEVFNDPVLFRNALRKRIRYSDTKLAPFNIRKSLKAFGVQSVSNFRPTIAKWVYKRFAPMRGGNVLDPCMGYGGRLFGAMASGVGSYTGVDVSIVTVSNNEQLANAIPHDKDIKLVCCPFEDWSGNEIYDLVFTSPPYFNIEKYDDSEFQSYIRYPNYGEWVNGFLRPLISESYRLLRVGGYLVLNVGNPIIEDTIRIGNMYFGSRDTYWMRLSKMLGKKNKSEISHKLEPIFVWRKD